MPARLFLVPAVLPHRFPDRLAIADHRRMRRHLDSVTAFQPREHRVQMLVVDAAQADLVIGVIVLDDEAGILLGQPLQRARQLDVVLAVGGLNGDRTIARWIFDLDGRRQLARAEPFPGLDGFDLGDRHNVAVAGLADLLRLFALDLEQRADAGVLAILGLEVRALADRAAERARQSKPAY